MPMEYASRAMTRTEQDSYAQIEKKFLAFVFALDRFHTYIYGKRITIETDHKPLISIVKKALTSAPKRLQRMLLRLQSYDFDLVYTPGHPRHPLQSLLNASTRTRVSWRRGFSDVGRRGTRATVETGRVREDRRDD